MRFMMSNSFGRRAFLSLGLWFGFALMASLGGCSRCAPGKEAHFTDESRKDPACAQEVKGALDAICKYLGMNTAMTDGDMKNMLDRNKIVKTYVRDGVQYKMTIGLRKDDGKCKLVVYKREKREPGKSSTTWGNYGAAVLKVCHCK